MNLGGSEPPPSTGRVEFKIALPKKFQILVDKREKKPYFSEDKFKNNRIETLLKTGDYSFQGGEDLITIERKSHVDLWGTLSSHERSRRFYNEISRMQEYKYRYIIIESSIRKLGYPNRYTNQNPNVIIGKVLAFMYRYGIMMIFAENRKLGQEITLRILYSIWDIERKKCPNSTL